METVHPLQQERERRGWSRAHLATLLHTSEISIFRWEHGQVTPQSYHRAKLAEIYGKSSYELGIDPRPPSSPPAAAASSTLPSSACYDPLIPLVSTTRIIGRDREVVDVRQRLCSNRVLTALQGLPGVGKTTLAACLAHDQEIRASFPDGVLWAGLGPEPIVSDVLRRWGRLLGLSSSEMEAFQDRRAWEAALRTAIGERRFLLVIDDAWKVDDALPLLVGGAHCAHLVTTRFPTLAHQVVPDGAIVLQELDTEHSFLLLETLAPKAMAYEPQHVQALLPLLGGLPLALTLIGNYLRRQSYNEHPRRIRMALDHLHGLHTRLHLSELPLSSQHYPSLFPEGVLSLHAVIALSDHLLENDTSTVFYALSVFPAKPHSFSEEAACQVTQCSVETLDTLVDAGLLESVGADRYTLHQTIADYARTHLQDQTPFQRLIEYSLRFIREHEKHYGVQAQERHLIQAAFEIASLPERQNSLIQLACAFLPCLLACGDYAHADRMVQQAYAAALAWNDEPSMVALLQYQGKVLQKQGHLSEAIGYFQDALQRARVLNLQERLCTLLIDLGSTMAKQSAYTEAESCIQEGLHLARQREQHEDICLALNVLSGLYVDQGHYLSAERCAREGLERARQLADFEQTVFLHLQLGVALSWQGKVSEAGSVFKQGLALVRHIGHRIWTGTLLLDLGVNALYEGDLERAEQYFQECGVLAQQTHQDEWVGVLHLNWAELELLQGRFDEAERHLQWSLEQAKELGRTRVHAYVLDMMGALALKRGQIEEAEGHFREMATLLPEKDRDVEALSQYGQARVAAARGRLHEARTYAETSLRLLEEIGNATARDVRLWMQNVFGE